MILSTEQQAVINARSTKGGPRVLHIITGLATGGAESSLVRVITRTRDDCAHCVVSLTTLGTRGAELEALGVPVHALGLARGAIAPQGLLALRKVVREFQPDCVQGWMYHGNLAASLLSVSGVKTGPVLWNVRHALDAWAAESLKRRALIRGSAWFARQPQHIVFNSHRSRAQHEALGFPSASALVIPNGVDTVRFPPDDRSRAQLRATFGIPDDAFVVGMIARVDPLKDHPTFFAAVERHAQRDRNTWYVLAGTDTAQGTPDSPGRLDAMVESLDRRQPGLGARVIRLGDRRDVPEILRACDVVAMTSRSEGSPNAVSEAMACGRPCVVTDVGDAARLVGDTGVVVSVGDSAAIADAFHALQADSVDRTARGNRAALRIESRFSADAECAAYVSLWKRATRAQSHCASHDPHGLDRARHGKAAPRILMVTTVSTTLRAFLLPYADHFRRRGWRVDALAARAGRDALLTEHFDACHDITWARNPFSAQNVAALRHIRRVVQQGHYDVVHVHTPVAAFVTRFALRRLDTSRVIYTAHGFHAHAGRSRIGNAAFRWLERRAARWTDYLVVINAHDEGLARTDCLADKGRLAHHPGIGVDVKQYRPLTRSERVGVRTTLGITAAQPVIAVVSEFNRNKRQRDIVAALSRLRDEAETPMPIVLFIGEGPLKEQVSRQAKRACVDSHVRFLGHRDDVARLVGCADALVLASAREGLPRCLLEAMAMGIPAIASEARGSVDLLGDGRGWLYPVGDSDRLAERLRRVLCDPEYARVRAARATQWVKEHAALDSVLARHEVLYNAALRDESLPDLLMTHEARHGRSARTSSAA